MTEPHRTFDQQQHVESHAPYIKVFLALLVFTILEYFYARFSKESFFLLVGGLMVLAVTKAVMVAWYFMHLKFEGRWVYIMLIPAGILACVLIFALYPDIGTQRTGEEIRPDDEDVTAAPLVPLTPSPLAGEGWGGGAVPRAMPAPSPLGEQGWAEGAT